MNDTPLRVFYSRPQSRDCLSSKCFYLKFLHCLKVNIKSDVVFYLNRLVLIFTVQKLERLKNFFLKSIMLNKAAFIW